MGSGLGVRTPGRGAGKTQEARPAGGPGRSGGTQSAICAHPFFARRMREPPEIAQTLGRVVLVTQALAVSLEDADRGGLLERPEQQALRTATHPRCVEGVRRLPPEAEIGFEQSKGDAGAMSQVRSIAVAQEFLAIHAVRELFEERGDVRE